jgi:asparagine synthase (glutamine-hydrolysing)
LVDITSRLHNTALQRVDRSASAHGLVAHVAFLDPEVVDYALRIPAELKIRDGVEKWILRRAMDGLLPESVLNRRKAKFWEGAGVGDLMAQHADERIGDDEFCRERRLPNGWTLNAKEELMYYRIFRDHFGDFADLSWMGRTKGAPSVAVS